MATDSARSEGQADRCRVRPRLVCSLPPARVLSPAWFQVCSRPRLAPPGPGSPVPPGYSIALAALHCCRQVDVVMAGWPGAAQDRLPADVPRARHGRPGCSAATIGGGGRGGWGGFIPHAGPGRGLWHVGGVEVDAGLAGGSRGAMREQPGDDLGRPAAADQPPDDYPYRARWRVSSLLHAADRAGADQGSDRRNAATPHPWPGCTGEVRGVVHVLLDDEAVARCRAELESAGIGVADKREPGARPPGGPRRGPCRRTCRWWPASTTRCPGRPATTRRGPGMRHGGSTCSSPTGRRPAPGRRGSAWTTAGCATGARRWKASPPRRCHHRRLFRQADGVSPAGSHLQGLRSPEGDVGVVEGDLLRAAAAGRPAARQAGRVLVCAGNHVRPGLARSSDTAGWFSGRSAFRPASRRRR